MRSKPANSIGAGRTKLLRQRPDIDLQHRTTRASTEIALASREASIYMHMTRKGQLGWHDGQAMSAAQQFYSLAF